MRVPRKRRTLNRIRLDELPALLEQFLRDSVEGFAVAEAEVDVGGGEVIDVEPVGERNQRLQAHHTSSGSPHLISSSFSNLSFPM